MSAFVRFDLVSDSEEAAMASYPPGPYTLEIPYVVQGFSHSLEINCDVIGTPATGDSPLTVILRTKDNEGENLANVANALWDATRQLLQGTTLAATYNLWKRQTGNNDRLFVSGGTLLNPNGSSSAATVLASYAIFTWRSAKGGIMKIQVMEPTVVSTNRNPLAVSGIAGAIALNTWVLSDSGAAMARDRSFPVASMNESYGQNDDLFAARFRS